MGFCCGFVCFLFCFSFRCTLYCWCWGWGMGGGQHFTVGRFLKNVCRPVPWSATTTSDYSQYNYRIYLKTSPLLLPQQLTPLCVESSITRLCTFASYHHPDHMRSQYLPPSTWDSNTSLAVLIYSLCQQKKWHTDTNTAWPCIAKLRQACRHNYELPDHILPNKANL